MSDSFDVIVIGAGPAGENAAARAAAGGLSVAIVESDLVGGECSYWACMPSKALLMPAALVSAARRSPGAREAVTGELDLDAVLARRDELAANYQDDGQVEWLESAGLTLIRGRGRLAGQRTVAVDTPDGSVRTLTADRAVVLAGGSAAKTLPIQGLDQIRSWDSRGATSAKEVPQRLLIVGGGVVAVEMAQAWHSLGAEEVTLLVHGERLLSMEEPFAGEELGEAFAELGIDVRTNTEMKAVRRDGHDGPVTASLDDGSQIVADELLVAVGRVPRTDHLGLETVGLEPGKTVEVDDHLRATGVDGGWLYAVGDINGRVLLTHMGKYQARIAGDVIAGREPAGGAAWADHRAVPRVIFTDPQVAAVGLTEKKARDGGVKVRTVKVATGSVAGAAELGQGIKGSCQLVIDEDHRVVVGATFTGPAVGEMLHAATIAIAGEVPLDRLWHAVPSFPTVSEVWLRLLEQYGL